MFEPFFTTKDIGKGTGLGLSQVYGFAHQSGGAATIASSARRGTVVTLFLPRTWETPALPQEPSAAVATKKHAGTVLLVEDNAEVAEVGKAYFEELGYKVKQAASAQAGLDLIERERDIDLVFSDILMPGGMNGLELADAIRRRFPHIVVLLTTGYSSSAQDAVRQGFAVCKSPTTSPRWTARCARRSAPPMTQCRGRRSWRQDERNKAAACRSRARLPGFAAQHNGAVTRACARYVVHR